MKVKNDILYIDSEITDEEVEEFIATISQDNINKIEVKTSNLGASIIQILLIKKREKEIIVEDEILRKIFENVVYKSL